jgi:hypothetical protein
MPQSLHVKVLDIVAHQSCASHGGKKGEEPTEGLKECSRHTPRVNVTYLARVTMELQDNLVPTHS